jgi:hypothetical protein
MTKQLNHPHGHRFQKDLTWMKEVHAVDDKCIKIICSVSKKYKYFLIVGNYQSGKNSFSDVLCGYLHEINKEPLIAPSIEEKSIRDIQKSAKWKWYQKLLKHPMPIVVPVGHTDYEMTEDYLEQYPKMTKNFDVVFDMRMLPTGHRILCQIYIHNSRTNSLRCIYKSVELAKFCKIKKAA